MNTKKRTEPKMYEKKAIGMMALQVLTLHSSVLLTRYVNIISKQHKL